MAIGMTDVEIVLGVTGLPKYEADMRRASRATGNASSEIKGQLKELASSFGLTFGAAAVGAFIKGSVMAFAEFGQGLADLKAITGATDDQMKFFGESAKTMGLEVEGGANAVTRAFSLIGSAKPELLNDAKALAAVTKEAITLSQASGLELPQAATALTDALNQFKAPAQAAGQYINVLGAAAKFGSAEIPQTTDALLQFGTAAAAASITIEESAAAIQTLAAQGRKGAEAGTDLRAIFGKMASIDALPKGALAQLKKFGVDLGVVKDASLPLAARLKELGKVSGDATALMEIFGEEHKIAAGILLNSQDVFGKLVTDVTGTGVAAEQAAIRNDTLSHSFLVLQNRIGGAMLEVGEALKPLIDDVIKGFAPAMETVRALLISAFEPFRSLGEAIGSLGSVFGIASGGGSIFADVVSVLATTTKIAMLPLKGLLWVATKLTEAFTWVVGGIKGFIDQSPILSAAIDVMTFPLRTLGDALGWVGEQLGLVTPAANNAANGFNLLDIGLNEMRARAGATKEQLKAFTDQFDKTKLAGYSTGDAMKVVVAEFNAFLHPCKDAAKATDDVAKAFGTMSDKAIPAAGSIDALNAKLSELKKQYSATGSELQRIKLGGQIEAVEFQLMKFGQEIDFVKPKIEALGSLMKSATELPQATMDMKSPFTEEFFANAEAGLPRLNVFAASVKAIFQDMKKAVKEYMVSMAADVAFGIGEAIGSGASIGEVFSKALKEMAVLIPKMVGMALLNQAATVPSPASLPLAIAGLALIGASGLLSGIFKAQEAKKQESQSIATDVGTSSALPRQQGSGLGAFIDNQANIGQQVVDALVGQKLTLQVGETTMDAYVGNAQRRNNERRGQ